MCCNNSSAYGSPGPCLLLRKTGFCLTGMRVALPLQTGMGSERSPSLPRMLSKKSGSPRPKTIIMDTLWVSLVKRKLRKSLKK